MKRYWKTIVITLAVLLGIGTFYIRNAVSASSLPQFTFVKESGDDSEIMPIVLAGSFDRSGHFGSSEGLQIVDNEIQYSSEQSLIEQFTEGYRGEYGLIDLQEKYRSFMRGKWGSASFYEDKDFLLYATIKEEGSSEKKDFSFSISLLDKENEERTDIKIEIPMKRSIIYMGEVDVQMVGRMLKVVAEHAPYTNSDFEDKEVHVYTIDLSSKKIIADDLIFYSENAGESFINYQRLAQNNIRNPNKYIVYEKYSVQEGTDSYGNKTMEKRASELIAYNLETGKQQTIQTGRLNNPDYSGYESFYNDSAIYVIERNAEKLKIETYDIHRKKLMKTFEFPVLSSKNTEDTKVIIKNSRIYLYSADESYPRQTKQPPAQLIIADLMTGKTVYKGKLVAKKGTEMEGILRTHYMEIK
ncbi:hypothetical protein D0469_01340 [Peribacillus saganii]|uniref:Uncharacterized protein n=1 Tax=Peribacillus saganii TaxID=2303992 RepID=A0A372LUN3_9BACI|nr:hypothetical protein [Peribacillus saganii]RFU71510.1 hypothetical protein D0469_01340 [Peribacillus saganii]